MMIKRVAKVVYLLATPAFFACFMTDFVFRHPDVYSLGALGFLLLVTWQHLRPDLQAADIFAARMAAIANRAGTALERDGIVFPRVVAVHTRGGLPASIEVRMDFSFSQQHGPDHHYGRLIGAVRVPGVTSLAALPGLDRVEGFEGQSPEISIEHGLVTVQMSFKLRKLQPEPAKLVDWLERALDTLASIAPAPIVQAPAAPAAPVSLVAAPPPALVAVPAGPDVVSAAGASLAGRRLDRALQCAVCDERVRYAAVTCPQCGRVAHADCYEERGCCRRLAAIA